MTNKHEPKSFRIFTTNAQFIHYTLILDMEYHSFHYKSLNKTSRNKKYIVVRIQNPEPACTIAGNVGYHSATKNWYNTLNSSPQYL